MADDPMQNVSRAARDAFDAMRRRAAVAERRAEDAERRAADAETRALDAHALRGIMDRLDVMADRIDALESNQRRRAVVPKLTVEPSGSEGVLYGVKAIAEFLGVRQRQALGLIERGHLPHYRIGKIVCANRATMKAWLAAQEGR